MIRCRGPLLKSQNCMNDSTEFQEDRIELQWKMFSSSQSTSSRSKSTFYDKLRYALPLDTWELFGSQENFFVNPRPMFDSSRTHQGILHSTSPSATGGIPVQRSTGRPVARGEERIGSTTTMPMSERRPSTMNSFLPAEIPQNFYGWTAKTTAIGASVRQIPHSIIIYVLEDKVQNPSKFLIRFSPRMPCYGSKMWRWSIEWMKK